MALKVTFKLNLQVQVLLNLYIHVIDTVLNKHFADFQCTHNEQILILAETNFGLTK